MGGSQANTELPFGNQYAMYTLKTCEFYRLPC